MCDLAHQPPEGYVDSRPLSQKTGVRSGSWQKMLIWKYKETLLAGLICWGGGGEAFTFDYCHEIKILASYWFTRGKAFKNFQSQTQKTMA